MQRLLSLPVLVLSCAGALCAQSYTPKEIRFEGAKTYAPADLLATSGFKHGAITVKEIEAGMQRLADTGLFSGTRYEVNDQALTIMLTPIEAKQSLPLRFGNFVWWSPAELGALVHARVPLFTGRVPLDGTLTDSVKQALVALLAEKGVAATLDAMTSTDRAGGPLSAITLTISTPEIKIGEIHFEGASASDAARLANIRERFAGDDFDENSTPEAVVDRTKNVFRDDGYLDIAVDPPGHADAPRASGTSRFLVDLNATVHDGELYRVTATDVRPAAPFSAGELKKLVAIKPGDPARQTDLQVAKSELASHYHHAGYLDAEAQLDMPKDTATHHVTYNFTMVPGEIYHVASIQAAGLPPDQQQKFEHSLHIAPGAIDNDAVMTQLREGMMTLRSMGFVSGMTERRSRQVHTVEITIQCKRAPTR